MIKNLNEILENHRKWLCCDADGKRADLCRADLRRANLYGANLRRANLRRADLCRADLSGADLSGADLSGADLSGSNLCRADLSGSNLSGADLYGANLYGANLYGANLRRADLYGANLYGANLSGADLRRADLSGAKIELTLLNKFYPICCPEVGSFVGWKKVRGNLIVKLEVTENAKRSSAFGRKCRCNEAKVLDIQNFDGTSADDVIEAYSQYDENFVYRVGETVRVDDFDDDRRNECAAGIHFFITRQEAVDY